MYKFTREDFEKVVNDERFISGVKFAINECFFPDSEFYRGDKKLFENIEREDYWNIIQNLPLPYISMCEDPIKYKKEYGKDDQSTIDVRGDYEDRIFLLKKSNDKYDPEWWCLIHNCQALAVFIIYPMLKILYPNQQFYLYDGISHTVIINSELKSYTNISSGYTRDINNPCIFDLVSHCLSINSDWIFPIKLDILQKIISGGKTSFDESRRITSDKIIDWYVDNFDCVDSSKFKQWLNSL